MEKLIERTLYASRWLLVPMYLGLAIVLIAFTIRFGIDTITLFRLTFAEDEAQIILAALTLVDLALVASLVVMVMISGYENFVSRIDVSDDNHRLTWLGKLDSGTLKVKVAAAIVAISSIHLLKAFMDADTVSNDKLMWLVIMHLTFVVSALLMGLLDKMSSTSRRGPDAD